MVPRLPRIALVMGDPSGVGPELATRVLAVPANLASAEVHVLASRAEVEAAAVEAGVSVPIADQPGAGRVVCVGSERADLAVERGKPSIEGGMRVKVDLLAALAMFQRGEVDAIMFTPLNKSALHDAGMREEDELRWFAKTLGYEGFTSELNLLPNLTTARVTSHIGIADVAPLIKTDRCIDAIHLLHEVLLADGKENPRILVCALNPHGGENGQFGREEIDEIAPAVKQVQGEGLNVEGPYPSDTLFLRARDGGADGVVTMYHDQGQIAIKLLGFDQGVTVQGGLPVPICTPAHGTAYDLVGTGKASLGPTQRAFDVCLGLARQNIARADARA